MTTDTRPRPAASIATIRKMGYEGEKQRQVTNGWYCRGVGDPATAAWEPLPGLPNDVFVYLPMGAPYERELYPDKGMKPLSSVPNKKAVAGRQGQGAREFRVDPPSLPLLQQVMEQLIALRPRAIQEIEVELAEVMEQLDDPAGLMKGESGQLRRKRDALKKRLLRLADDREFDAMKFYRAFVQERQNVIKAQMDPALVRQAELEREAREWDDNLRDVGASEDALPTDSTSSSRRSTRSTPPEPAT